MEEVNSVRKGPGRPPNSTNSSVMRKRGQQSASESMKFRMSISGERIPQNNENKKSEDHEKRSPGRPNKFDVLCTEKALDKHNLYHSEKRGRGRPKNSERKHTGRPKKIADFTSNFPQDDSSATEEVLKRGRGRPKKVTNSKDLTSEDDFEQSKQSPSKSNIIQHGVIERGPGRPKKVIPTLGMTCGVKDGTGIDGFDQSREYSIDVLCNGSLVTED